MFNHRHLWFLIGILFTSGNIIASQDHIVDHHDPITIDSQLTLAKLIDITVEKYPGADIISALQQQSDALKNRGDSWFAGALTASMYYRDDTLSYDSGNREIEGAIEVPLWNWGQREAGQKLAQQAKKNHDLKSKVIKWKVAGLLRSALWEMELQKQRYELAVKVYTVTEKLAATIKRRVELGDLSRADYLLAKSELLQKQSLLISIEAEMMHSRKSYSSLTQIERIPSHYQEKQSHLTKISQHPALNIANAYIERKRRQLNWVKSEGSGQSIIALGGKSERGSRAEDNIDSMTFSLSVPFGGGAHLAPDIAASNLELRQAISERDQLYRTLDKAFHEAEHQLKVDRAELALAKELKEIANAHLKMARLSFDEGEINLMDYLKVHSRAQAANQNASEKNILLQRDIALYNQAVGVLP